MADLLIVDDHLVVRGFIKQVLELEPDISVVGEAGTAADALQLLPTHPWDAVILDLSLPDQNGIEVLRAIKRDFAHVPVLILSMQSAAETAPFAYQSGAAGYLMKENAPEELLTAVRTLLSGTNYFYPPL